MASKVDDRPWGGVYLCFVCQSPLKWRKMREHFQEVHPDVALTRPLSMWDWHPINEKKKRSGQKKKQCYLCRRLLNWGYMRAHFRSVHPNYILPDRVFRDSWPTVQEAAVGTLEQQATAPTAEPSIDNSALPIVYVYAYTTSTDQARGDEQRDQIDLTQDDVAAQAIPDDLLSFGDEMNTDQTPGDEQLFLNDSTHEDVAAEATHDDPLQLVHGMSTDPSQGGEQLYPIDLTGEDVAAEATRDDPPTVDPITTDHTPAEEQEDYSDINDWNYIDFIARADEKTIRELGFPITGVMSMDQASNGQRDGIEPNDEELAEATPDDVSPIIDGMEIDPDPDSGQREIIDLTHENAADEVDEDVISAADSAQDVELYAQYLRDLHEGLL